MDVGLVLPDIALIVRAVALLRIVWSVGALGAEPADCCVAGVGEVPISGTGDCC